MLQVQMMASKIIEALKKEKATSKQAEDALWIALKLKVHTDWAKG